MIENIVEGLAAHVLHDLGKQVWKERGSMLGRLKNLFKPGRANMVFIPEAAVISIPGTTERKLFVRLILLGSSLWTRGQEVYMEPDFAATLFPPGRGGYRFTRSDLFATAKVPKGMHAYFIGEKRLEQEHLEICGLDDKVGVKLSGHIDVQGLGKFPIFPVTLLAGSVGEGGGFRNEPIELRVLKQE